MAAREDLTNVVSWLRAEKRTLRATATEIPLMRELADVLEPILQNPAGQLKAEMETMWELLKSAPKPEKAVFVPKPHHSNSRWAAIWWLQLLTMIAQGFSSAPRRIPPRDRRLKMGRLNQLITHARHAWEVHVKLHGARAVTGQIMDAVERLVDCLPRGLELDGRYLVHGGVRIEHRLTDRAYAFMRLLVEAKGRPVDLRAFHQAGVPHPHSTRHRLTTRSEFAFLDRLIQTAPGGGYVLRHD